LDLEAVVRAGEDTGAPAAATTVRGQEAVALATGRVTSVALVPADPPACPEAVRAVLDADWVVLGPGSWFSSVIPHLLVPELADALMRTSARRLVTLNLAPQVGETAGLSPHAHLEVLRRHAPDLRLDVVLADPKTVPDVVALERVTATMGGEVALASVGMSDGSPRHDPDLLATAYQDIFSRGRI
jgi:uncharacterized cofD-like protein